MLVVHDHSAPLRVDSISVNAWSVLIAAHASAAILGLLLGGYQLIRHVKGDRVHRHIGWIWIIVMAFVSSSSFAIRELRHGQLSLLHVLSVVTLVSLILGVVAIRKGDVRGHRSAMAGSWFGLIGAFIGAVAVPVRRIPTLAINNPVGACTAVILIVALTLGLIWLTHHLPPLTRTPPKSSNIKRGTTEPSTSTSTTANIADI